MTHPMTIAGRPVVGSDRLVVEDPALGTPFAEVPDCSPETLDAAVSAAARTTARWAGTPWEDRREVLQRCGESLSYESEEVARLLTREQGKPLERARAEVKLAVEWFDMTAQLCVKPETVADDQDSYVRVDRVPHGVVAAIAPSNYPIILSVAKLAPALLAGNPVVLKPSPLTPLSTLLMGRAVCDALPPGVLNVISGNAGLGERLARHPGISLVSFTGSVNVGRRVAAAAAGDVKATVLELGGNDACILLPGVDIQAVAQQVFDRAMDNSGQYCAAIKRVYVAREQQQELVSALATIAGKTTVGPGLDPATDLGPLVDARQVARVDEMVRSAVDAGARVVTGGSPLDRPGHFYPPTIVTDLPTGIALEVDEQFGPVLPVIAYDSVDEAVDRANATEFGLGGSVWGEEDAACEVAQLLDAGTVWVNSHGVLRGDAPFGGFRSSGRGVEYGFWGMLEYTRPKVLNVAH
jgi:acyl-CoA reductase-like NAD-dependent aldehyde dehydrogenase